MVGTSAHTLAGMGLSNFGFFTTEEKENLSRTHVLSNRRHKPMVLFSHKGKKIYSTQAQDNHIFDCTEQSNKMNQLDSMTGNQCFIPIKAYSPQPANNNLFDSSNE